MPTSRVVGARGGELMTIFDYVADMFRRMVAAVVFVLLLSVLLVVVVGIMLLVGWLASGARF